MVSETVLTREELVPWMGYPTATEMDRDHDELHEAVARFLTTPSYSLREARGEIKDTAGFHLARYEEDAVLALQRYVQRLRLLTGRDIDVRELGL